jgi:hypothetical protein
MMKMDLRILELANPSEFLALNAPRVIRITLDLLLAASNTRYCESLSWLSRLCNSPVRVDSLAINVGLAMRAIVIEVA